MAITNYKYNATDNTFVGINLTDPDYPTEETVVFSDPAQVAYLVAASAQIADLEERVTALEEA